MRVMEPCESKEEIRFMDAGVNNGVEVKTEELRTGRNGELKI